MTEVKIADREIPIRDTARSNTRLWWLDTETSKGAMSSRHWLLGRCTFKAHPAGGHLVTSCEGVVDLSYDFGIVPPAQGLTCVRMESVELARIDATAFDVKGEIRVESERTEIDLRVHDLGIMETPESNPRHHLIVSGRIERAPAALCRAWPRLTLGRFIEVYAHTEWIPESPTLRAA